MVFLTLHCTKHSKNYSTTKIYLSSDQDRDLTTLVPVTTDQTSHKDLQDPNPIHTVFKPAPHVPLPASQVQFYNSGEHQYRDVGNPRPELLGSILQVVEIVCCAACACVRDLMPRLEILCSNYLLSSLGMVEELTRVWCE